MTNLTTISEKDILYYALYAILEKIEKEEAHLKEHPTSTIAPARIERYNHQLKEVNARIIEIENA